MSKSRRKHNVKTYDAGSKGRQKMKKKYYIHKRTMNISKAGNILFNFSSLLLWSLFIIVVHCGGAVMVKFQRKRLRWPPTG